MVSMCLLLIHQYAAYSIQTNDSVYNWQCIDAHAIRILLSDYLTSQWISVTRIVEILHLLLWEVPFLLLPLGDVSSGFWIRTLRTEVIDQLIRRHVVLVVRDVRDKLNATFDWRGRILRSHVWGVQGLCCFCWLSGRPYVRLISAW